MLSNDRVELARHEVPNSSAIWSPTSRAESAPKRIENHLIERLPRGDRRRFLAQCVSVDLALSQVLATPEMDAEHVYFPVESFVSLLTVVSGEVGLEVGMVGREGMLGAQLSLGVNATPLHALVQGPGAAWRIDAPEFVVELGRSEPLRREIGLYVYVLMTQLATSAGCADITRSSRGLLVGC